MIKFNKQTIYIICLNNLSICHQIDEFCLLSNTICINLENSFLPYHTTVYIKIKNLENIFIYHTSLTNFQLQLLVAGQFSCLIRVLIDKN